MELRTLKDARESRRRRGCTEKRKLSLRGGRATVAVTGRDIDVMITTSPARYSAGVPGIYIGLVYT